MTSLIMGALAWMLAPKFSRMVFPENNQMSVNVSVSADDIVMIGSFLIGGYYLIELGPSLIAQGISLFFEMTKADPSAPSHLGARVVQKNDIVGLLSTIVTVVVALFLTFRPRMLATMFLSLRSTGLSKIEKPE